MEFLYFVCRNNFFFNENLIFNDKSLVDNSVNDCFIVFYNRNKFLL